MRDIASRQVHSRRVVGQQKVTALFYLHDTKRIIWLGVWKIGLGNCVCNECISNPWPADVYIKTARGESNLKTTRVVALKNRNYSIDSFLVPYSFRFLYCVLVTTLFKWHALHSSAEHQPCYPFPTCPFRLANTTAHSQIVSCRLWNFSGHRY